MELHTLTRIEGDWFLGFQVENSMLRFIFILYIHFSILGFWVLIRTCRCSNFSPRYMRLNWWMTIVLTLIKVLRLWGQKVTRKAYMTLLLSMLSIPRSELTLSIPHLLLKSSISLLLHLFSLHILLLGTMVAIVSMEQPIQIDRPWMPCDYSQHVRRLKARLDQMNKFLQRMQLSVLVELSTIKELLNVLVKVWMCLSTYFFIYFLF